MNYAAGDLVVHTRRPAWGVGVVAGICAGKVWINFDARDVVMGEQFTGLLRRAGQDETPAPKPKRKAVNKYPKKRRPSARTWTPAQDNRLRELWKDNTLTAAQVGEKMEPPRTVPSIHRRRGVLDLPLRGRGKQPPIAPDVVSRVCEMLDRGGLWYHEVAAEAGISVCSVRVIRDRERPGHSSYNGGGVMTAITDAERERVRAHVRAGLGDVEISVMMSRSRDAVRKIREAM